MLGEVPPLAGLHQRRQGNLGEGERPMGEPAVDKHVTGKLINAYLRHCQENMGDT